MPSATFKFAIIEFPDLASAAAPPRRDLVSKTSKRKLKLQASQPSAVVGKTGISKRRGGGQTPKRIATRSEPSSPSSPPADVVEDLGQAKKSPRRPTKSLLKRKDPAPIDPSTTTIMATVGYRANPTKLNTLLNVRFNEPAAGILPTTERTGRKISFSRRTSSTVFAMEEGEARSGSRKIVMGSPIGVEVNRLKKPATSRQKPTRVTLAQKEDIIGPSTGLVLTRSPPKDRGCRTTCWNGVCSDLCLCRSNGIHCDKRVCPCRRACPNHDPKPPRFPDMIIDQWERGHLELHDTVDPKNTTIESVDSPPASETSVQDATISDAEPAKRPGRVTMSPRSSPYSVPKSHPSSVIRDRRKRRSAPPSVTSPSPSSPQLPQSPPVPVIPGLPPHGINLDRDLFSFDFWTNILTSTVADDELKCLDQEATGQEKWLTDGAIYMGLLKEASLANIRGGKYALLHPGIFAEWPIRLDGESDDDLVQREPIREVVENSIYYRQAPEYLLMPLHHSDHWALAIYRVKESTCVIYDSLSPNKSVKTERLEKLKRLISKLVGHHIAETIKFRYAFNTHSERQSDGVECGIFTIVNGRRLMEGRRDLRNKRKAHESIGFDEERKRLRESLDAVQADLAAIERANTAAAQQAGQVAPVPQPMDIRPPAPQPAPPLRRSQRNTVEANRKIKACCNVIGSRTPKAFGARRRRR